MANAQVILLEKVDKLGGMGDVVTVKPGYARNYLLPQKKALRASKENIAYFEGQRKALEADNEKTRKAAEKDSKSLSGMKVPLIRQASESGQLYGSVTSRDIADQINANSEFKIQRSMVRVNNNFKTIGLFDVDVAVHPEVTVQIVVNIARTPEEAEIQAETGKALVADANFVEDTSAEDDATVEEQFEDVLEEGALETEKEKQEAAAVKAVEDAEKAKISEEKAAKKAAKKAEKEAAEATEEGDDAPTELKAAEE